MPVPEFPLRIFFDGACPLCSREIEHYLRQDHAGRLLPIDISTPDFDPQPYGIALTAFMHELHAIDRSERVYRGVEAFRAIWQAFPDSTAYRLLTAVVALPLINPLARLGYRGFARLRPHLPGRGNGCTEGACRIGKDKRFNVRGDDR